MLLIIIQIRYINNNIFRFSLIGGINIITHAIFMKIRIVVMLHADWLYGVLRHLECPTDSVRIRDLYEF